MSPKIGQQIECTIESLAFGGAGVARLDGMALFVEDALPGERVIAEITKPSKKFAHARTLKIHEPSAERVVPPCRYYGQCGGCQLQHLRYDVQVEWKKKQVGELLKRIGGVSNFTLTDSVPSPNPYGYRNTIRLHRIPGNPLRYGYYCRDGRSLIAISRCLIAQNVINEILSDHKNFIDSGRSPAEIILHAGTDGNVAVCTGGGNTADIVEVLCDTRFTIPPASFFQVNRAVAALLVEKVRGWMQSSRCQGTFFDLYCGVGVFSVLLGRSFSRVIGIDCDVRAIAHARVNSAPLDDKRFSFIAGQVESSLPGIYKRHILPRSIMLLDPPRTGVGEGVIKFLREADRRVEKIIYVSCNPATLSRDLNRLCTNSRWRLDTVAIFDMFPQTAHIEVCCSIVRENCEAGIAQDMPTRMKHHRPRGPDEIS
ncbi:MAG: class I SAM-dependent RNA methyltransferase [Candidatus Aureabacteria bacterium]|nr:class I SAM-dependent RNA methyltransferase [Candidatus Auribacterota bacterium]